MKTSTVAYCIAFCLLVQAPNFAQQVPSGAGTLPADSPQIRQEIHQIESVLAKLPDRGAALFFLAHDYAHFGCDGLPAGDEFGSLRRGQRADELNGTTIGYDANGNIQNDGVAAYTWNGRNQLISRASTGLHYDSYGRRTLNATGNNLLYEGWNAAQELSGTTPVANRILGDIDEFFSRTDSTGGYSPITDALGSVLALTNSSGNIATQYGYDPFGTTSYGGTSANVLQYTSRENDGNGLYSYRARYYSPQFGRFISEDPIGFDGGQTNLYAYTDDDPTNFVDPLGLQGQPPNCPLGDPTCRPQKPPSNCGAYYSAGRSDLGYICGLFPDNPQSNCKRACLQNAFNGRKARGKYDDPLFGPSKYGALGMRCLLRANTSSRKLVRVSLLG